MALTHDNALKAAATDAVTALLGPQEIGGTIFKLLNSGDTILMETVFVDSETVAPFGAANGTTGIATAEPIENGIVTTAGTATKFRVENADGPTGFGGTVGTSGADINLNNNVLVEDQIVQITTLTYRALPA